MTWEITAKKKGLLRGALFYRNQVPDQSIGGIVDYLRKQGATKIELEQVKED